MQHAVLPDERAVEIADEDVDLGRELRGKLQNRALT
jgi:hypothetical protein